MLLDRARTQSREGGKHGEVVKRSLRTVSLMHASDWLCIWPARACALIDAKLQMPSRGPPTRLDRQLC